MKKYYILCLILISNSYLIFAQDLNIGISTGGLLSWKTYQNKYNFSTQSPRLAAPITLHFNYKINNHFSLELPLSYASEGYSMNYKIPSSTTGEIGDFSYLYRHKYLRLPINLHYTFNNTNLPFDIGIFVGISSAYLTTQKLKYRANNEVANRNSLDPSNSFVYTQELEFDFIKDFDFGMNAGLRFSKMYNKSTFFIDLGYYKGLININTSNRVISNNHIKAQIGYMYKL